MFREFEIQVVRVLFPHGAASRIETCKGAAGLLLPKRGLRARGWIQNSRNATSRMSGWLAAFACCQNKWVARRERVFRSRARTGRTPKRRIDFSITTKWMKRKFLPAIFKRHESAWRRQTVRFWCCTIAPNFSFKRDDIEAVGKTRSGIPDAGGKIRPHQYTVYLLDRESAPGHASSERSGSMRSYWRSRG
jgi:hypothetical protein